MLCLVDYLQRHNLIFNPDVCKIWHTGSVDNPANQQSFGIARNGLGMLEIEATY